MTGRYWLAALAVCVVSSWVWAEDAYTIKVKENVAGDVIAVERTDTLKGATKIVDADGKAIKEDADGKAIKDDSTDSTQTYIYKYNETILEQKTGERPTRLSRHYEKAEKTEGGRTTPLPYQGKTVLIEKKDLDYSFRVEGGKSLSIDDAETLDGEFNSSVARIGDQTHLARLFLPAKAVRLNEVRKADTDPLVKQLTERYDVGIDPLKAKGSAVLTRVYKLGDKQCGVVHCEAEVPIESIGYGGAKTDLEYGAKMTFRFDIDGCLDGPAEGGAIKVTISAKVNGTCAVYLPDKNDLKLILSIESKSTITRHQERAK